MKPRPVHLEMTREFAEWLLHELWYLADQRPGSPTNSTLRDLASSMALVSTGAQDKSGVLEDYMVTSP